MIITEKAAEEILNIMKRVGMSPDDYFLNFAKSNNGEDCGMGFVKKDTWEFNNPEWFHGLGVVVKHDINMSDIVIDVMEVDGRVGIIFSDVDASLESV